MNIYSPIDRSALMGFFIRFMLVSGILYLLLYWLPRPWVFDPIKRHKTQMCGIFLGLEPTVEDMFISAGGFSVKIVTECTAIYMAVLFPAFIFAYPSSIKKKFFGLAFGLPFLIAANFFRIVLIFLVGVHFRELFEYSHVYIGQIVMVLLVLLTCILWLQSVVEIAISDRPLGFIIRFVGYSSIPFIIWLYLDQGFVYANLLGVKTVLGLFGVTAQIPDRLYLCPHTFNTFHLIAFLSLVLATKSIDRAKKLRSLVVGLAILCIAHFLFRRYYALFVDLHLKSAMRPFIALIIITQWILPIGLWLFMVRHELFKQKSRFICPICGEEKKGLAAHIKAKHGEAALHTLQNRSPERPIAENRVKRELSCSKIGMVCSMALNNDRQVDSRACLKPFGQFGWLPGVLICLLATAAAFAINQDFFNRDFMDGIKRRYGEQTVMRVMQWETMLKRNAQREERVKLEQVNEFFNQMANVPDRINWGQRDYWATPVELLAANGGDCEDFAIAKYFSLRMIQVAEERLRLTYVRAYTGGKSLTIVPHLVLSYYAHPEAEPLLLDNLTPVIEPASRRRDLVPTYSFNGSGLWQAQERNRGMRIGDPSCLYRWQDLLKRMEH